MLNYLLKTTADLLNQIIWLTFVVFFSRFYFTFLAIHALLIISIPDPTSLLALFSLFPLVLYIYFQFCILETIFSYEILAFCLCASLWEQISLLCTSLHGIFDLFFFILCCFPFLIIYNSLTKTWLLVLLFVSSYCVV